MNWIGVITGDIVNSTEILNSGHREKLLEILHKTVDDINKAKLFGISKINIDIYRGDSFQIMLPNNTATILRLAILTRTALIANSTNSLRWDARIGIGVGKGEFIGDTISESDGEAFRLSGKAFDGLKSNKRLAILTPCDDFNEELEVSSAFADNIISNWTSAQAEVIYLHFLSGMPQKDIAQIVNKTPQAVSKLLSTANFDLILKYTMRYTNRIIKLIQK